MSGNRDDLLPSSDERVPWKGRAQHIPVVVLFASATFFWDRPSRDLKMKTKPPSVTALLTQHKWLPIATHTCGSSQYHSCVSLGEKQDELRTVCSASPI